MRGATTAQMTGNTVPGARTDDAVGLPPRLAPAWTSDSTPGWMSRKTGAVRIGVRHVHVQLLSDVRVDQTTLAYHGRDSLALAIVARNAAQTAALVPLAN